MPTKKKSDEDEEVTENEEQLAARLRAEQREARLRGEDPTPLNPVDEPA